MNIQSTSALTMDDLRIRGWRESFMEEEDDLWGLSGPQIWRGGLSVEDCGLSVEDSMQMQSKATLATGVRQAAKVGNLMAMRLFIETKKVDPNDKDVSYAPEGPFAPPTLSSTPNSPLLSPLHIFSRSTARLFYIGLLTVVMWKWCGTWWRRPRWMWRRRL